MTNQNFTDITLIIDASPSMVPQTKETIQGVNKFVQDQIAAAAESNQSVKCTLVTFSNYCTAVEGSLLNSNNYRADLGNGTALFDAIGETISATGRRFSALPEAKRPGKVIVVVVTDGENNITRLCSKEKACSMIQHQTNEYKWDFVFMGANQDAWSVGSQLGFIPGKTMSYAANDLGTQNAWASASSYTTRSVQAKNMAEVIGNAFTQADVDLQKGLGAVGDAPGGIKI